MKTKRITVNSEAAELLREIAEWEGVTVRQYIEALIHYAGSIHRRPGSWEASKPFDFADYDERRDQASADRWF